MQEVENHQKDLAICPTDDDEAIAPKTKKPHKQSFDYIWRTGVAGGLAGSAVYPPTFALLYIYISLSHGKTTC
jgi:hypothetical protein